MKACARIFLACYRRLFLLYPAKYRQEFGEELRDVYTLALDEAAEKGCAALLSYVLRDLKDTPGTIYHAHLRERRKQAINPMRKKPMKFPGHDLLGSPVSRYPPAAGKELFFAVLPHLLFMFLAAASQFLSALAPNLVEEYGTATTSSLAGIVAIIFAGFWVYAWRRRWPLWSASWYGYWAWIVLAIVALANQRFSVFISWQFNNFLILGAIGLLALGYLWLIRKDPLRGLLAIFFLMPVLSMSFIEFIPPIEEGILYLGAGLVVTLATLAILILRDVLLGALLALAANLLVGLGTSYISVFRPEYPKGIYHTPSLGEFITFLSVYAGLALVLITGPLLFWNIWDRARRRLVS